MENVLRLSEAKSKAIQILLEEANGNKSVALERIVEKEFEGGEWGGSLEELNNMSIVNVAKALYEGYEVELSKDEQINKLIVRMADRLQDGLISNEEYKAFIYGMYQVAKLFDSVESNALVNMNDYPWTFDNPLKATTSVKL